MSASAGVLRERITFERRGEDANGDALGPFSFLYRCRARIAYLRGGEEVMGQRLEGHQPIVLTVRYCAAIAGLSTADRFLDEGTSRYFDIKGIEPDDRHQWVDILAVTHAGGTPG